MNPTEKFDLHKRVGSLTPTPGSDTGDVSEPRTLESQQPIGCRLLSRSGVLKLLQLSDGQVQFLVNTQQLVPIRIAGQERFDTHDIHRLVEAYKATAKRRHQ